MTGLGMRVVLVSALLVAAPRTQNSTAKLRSEPSPTAAKAGSTVRWRSDLATARDESRASGKPLFWYVPTVARSPMDRVREIDRYMMAGPFSHPDIVRLLNAAFVPVKQAASPTTARQLGVAPVQAPTFVEPGFVIVAVDRGGELLRAHRLTTLHPTWLLARIRAFAKTSDRPDPRDLPVDLRAAWRAYGARDDGRADTLVKTVLATDPPAPIRAEAMYLRGALAHRNRRADQAVGIWQQIAREMPQESWAFKAAAEAEGHGPFAYGFEDYRDLPAKVLDITGEGPVTSRAPEGAYTEAELRRRSVRFLLDMQRPDGGFTDSRYDFGGTDSLPNVYVATTAIAGWALLDELEHLRQISDSATLARAETAVADIFAYCTDESHIAPSDTDERIWAHIYRIHLWSRWLDLHPDDDARRSELRHLVKAAIDMQRGDGAWFHEYANPFVSASVMVALDHARRAGVDVDGRAIALGERALLRCRARSGAFSYGQHRGEGAPRARVPSSAGRMPLCELALTLWHNGGADDQGSLVAALQAAFEHHAYLEQTRKYDDHATLGYGGFFFWYDMVGRTLAIRYLRDDALRADLARRQRALILSIPEIDGCFTDSHELGRVYGTASALLCLGHLRS